MRSEFKDSGIPFIGYIPQKWEILRNKNLFILNKKIVGGKFNNYQLLSLTKNGVILKDIEDVGGKQPESYDTYQEVRKGALILCLFDLDCSAVFSGVSKFDGMISPAYKVFYGNKKIHIGYYDYLFYHIARDRSYLPLSKNVRYTINEDEFGWIKNICPPLDEQKTIAEFLDCECEKIHSIIADIESQIELLIKYKESVISEAVTAGVPICESATWKSLRFKYFATISPPISKKGLRSDSEVTFLPMEYIRNGNFTPNISTLENLNSSYNCFENGDILIAKVTPCFENGNIVIAKDLMNDFGYGTSEIFVIRTKENMINRFLFYALQEEKFKKTAVSEMIGTAGLKRVSASFIKNYNFKVPQKNQQEAIADYLDAECAKIEDIIKEKQQALETIKEYKKSLIYEYVTGKKRVKEAK